MYSTGLGSYCHFTLQLIVDIDWRCRTCKFRSVVIIEMCTSNTSNVEISLDVWCSHTSKRSIRVVYWSSGRRKWDYLSRFQVSDISPLSLDAESRVFWIVKGQMRWRFALEWHSHSFQWCPSLWNPSNRHITKEKCKYGARDGKFDIITYFTLHFHKKPWSSSSPMT